MDKPISEEYRKTTTSRRPPKRERGYIELSKASRGKQAHAEKPDRLCTFPIGLIACLLAILHRHLIQIP